MVEIELIPKKLTDTDNTINVEMLNEEIWFLKHFIKQYRPQKIVEIGVAAGGNTVNLLKWKDKDAKLFSVDIATKWHLDETKPTGFMVDDVDMKDNWRLYKGHDYLDVCKEIGNDIDCIIIDTTHVMPGEILTFLAVLPQLKDGCIVILHDIHLNLHRFSVNKFDKLDAGAFCTGLLFGGVSSNMKWTLKSKEMSNIGAFVVDRTTRDNIKDLFHILCTSWYSFPQLINFIDYLKFVYENYPLDCYKLFDTCLKLHSKCFDMNIYETAKMARVDIINRNNKNSTVEIIDSSHFVNINFPDWFKRETGKGVVLQANEQSFDIKLKCIDDGLLNIYLRGPDVRNKSGLKVPRYVNFINFSVNNNIINENVVVWHDDPYIFEKNVKNGEIIEIHCEWENYKPPII